MVNEPVSPCKGSVTVFPLASKTYVAVCPFANVGVQEVNVELLCATEQRATIFPLALVLGGVGMSGIRGRVG
jgi:hypothetical protein